MFSFISIYISPSANFLMLELTNFLSLPAVQIRIGDKLEQRGKKSYVALYPKPNWLSSNDLIIDEALLWALIRKESSF